MANNTGTISSSNLVKRKPEKDTVSAEKIVILQSRTILYGQTPSGIAKQAFASMASEKGINPVAFAKKVIGMTLTEKLTLLREFYTKRSPDFIKLYDPLIESANSTSTNFQPCKRKNKSNLESTAKLRKEKQVQTKNSKAKKIVVSGTNFAMEQIISRSRQAQETLAQVLCHEPETTVAVDACSRAFTNSLSKEPENLCNIPMRKWVKPRAKRTPPTGIQVDFACSDKCYSPTESGSTESVLDEIFFKHPSESQKESVLSSVTKGTIESDLDEIFFNRKKRSQEKKSSREASTLTGSTGPSAEHSEPKELTLVKPLLGKPVLNTRSIEETYTVHERLVLEGKLVPNSKRRRL